MSYKLTEKTEEFVIRKEGKNTYDHDLIRSYLEEISKFPPLTGEEEVQIAKEIKNGIRVITRAILGSPLMLKEVINIGDKLGRCMLRVRGLTNMVDDESDDTGQEETLCNVKCAIKAIKKVSADNERLRNELYFVPKKSRELLRQQIKKNNKKIIAYLEEVNLSKHQMNRILSVSGDYINYVQEIQKEFGELHKHRKGLTEETKHNLKRKFGTL